MLEKLKNNRPLQLGIVTVFGVVLMLLLVFSSINNRNLSRNTTNNDENRMRYVLVNQDQGMRYNNKNYNLGRDFVTLANRDPKHTWVTATLDEANTGMQSGAYDVEVIIPEKFSSRILSLQDVNPKKAGIVYHVRKGQNEVTNIAVEKNVDSVVTYFNNRVVRMYFSSLVGKLRKAQVNAQTMANKQSSIFNNLNTQVKDPFSDLNGQFDSIFQTSSILADQYNDQTSADAAAFQNELKTMMQAADKKDQAGAQAQAEQTKSLSDVKDKLQKKLDELAATQSGPSSLQNLQDINNSFSALKKERKDLPALLREIDDQRAMLGGLKDELEQDYHVSVDNSVEQNTNAIESTLGTATDNNQQLLISFNQSVASQIQGLPTYQDLSGDNAIADLWDDNSKSEYQQAVTVLRAFAASQGSNFGANKTVITDDDGGSKTANMTVTLNFNEGNNSVSFSAPDGVKVKSVGSIDIQNPEFTAETSGSGSNFSVKLTKKDKDAKGNSAAATFNVEYTYDAKSPVTYNWKVNGKTQNSGQFMTGKDISSSAKTANANIKNTIAAGREVAAVYGNPQAGLAGYAGSISGGKLVKAQNSLAKAVDATPTIKKTPLSTRAKSLAEYYQKINNQISTLNQFVGEAPLKSSEKIPHLKKLSDVLSKEEISSYLEQSSKILDWYNSAQKTLQEANSPSGQNSKDATKSDSSKETNLGDDAKEIADNLGEKNDAGSDTDFKNSKKEADPVVKDLSKQTKDLQSKTSSIMSGLKSGVNNGQRQANNNQDYAKAFNNVMANARNGEADNGRVYNFLSNPIAAKGVYSSTRQQSITPYFMVLIGSLVALFVGLGITKYLPKRKLNDENAMNKLTRFWFNLPRTGVTLGIAIITGLIFGLVTMSSVLPASRINWLFYTTLVMAILITAAAVGSRHFKNITVFVYALLLGLFLLLTPFLGILTRANSFIQMVYTVSPLQNIETGYTVITNASMIGAPSMTALIILLIAVVVWGLFSKNDQLLALQETENEDEE